MQNFHYVLWVRFLFLILRWDSFFLLSSYYKNFQTERPIKQSSEIAAMWPFWPLKLAVSRFKRIPWKLSWILIYTLFLLKINSKLPGSWYFTPKDFSPRFLKGTLLYRSHSSVLGNLSVLTPLCLSTHRSRFTLESVYTACLLSRTLHWLWCGEHGPPPLSRGPLSPSGRRVRAG